MAETNGHAGELEATPPAETASEAELDALLAGIFEPVRLELAPGRWVEIRPLPLNRADELYGGGLRGVDMQKFLLARCVYIGGKVLGAELVETLPIALSNRLVPLVMKVNAMDWSPPGADGEGGASDPKA